MFNHFDEIDKDIIDNIVNDYNTGLEDTDAKRITKLQVGGVIMGQRQALRFASQRYVPIRIPFIGTFNYNRHLLVKMLQSGEIENLDIDSDIVINDNKLKALIREVREKNINKAQWNKSKERLFDDKIKEAFIGYLNSQE